MIWAQKLKMSRDPEHVNFRGVLSCVCWDLTGPLLTCRRVTRYAYNATFFFEILKGRCYGNRFWRELAKIGNFGPVTLEFCRRICIGRAYTLDFYHAFLVFKFNYFTASRMRYIVISLFVCLFVCPLSNTTVRISPNFLTVARFSFDDVIYTSGIVDDVMFHIMEGIGPN